MSYCQKHTNHHCIHAHQCKDPAHKNQKSLKTKVKTKQTKKTTNFQCKAPLQMIVDDQQCHFDYRQNVECSPIERQIFEKKIRLISQKNTELSRNALELQIENRKYKENNCHLQSQITYLREQLELLVNNHNIDIQQQIRKSLKQITRLNLQNKQKTSRIIDLQRELQELESKNYQLTKKISHLERKTINLQNESKNFRSAASNISNEKTNIKQLLRQKQKDFNALQERYDLLNKSLNNGTRQNEREIDSLKKQNQKFKKELNNVTKELKQQKQLFEIDKNSSQKLIKELKQQLSSKVQDISNAKKTIKQQKQKLQSLEDDYKHAKNIILRYEENNQNYDKEKSYIEKQKQHEFSQQQKEQQKENKKTVKNVFPSNQIGHKNETLEKQNEFLKQKNYQLEEKLAKYNEFSGHHTGLSQNTIIKSQDLYLSIGASEEFKKILQEKNSAIRKLIREKTALYNQIYESHVGNMPR